jgi:signal transduction histidine kinase/DNA-binding response OmpR family regulator
MTILGHVLVVEDESALLSALCNGLAANGYDAVGVSSGPDAIERMKERDFDILLSDLMMPRMDGIALLAEALRIDPHIVGVIMSGQGTVQTAVDAMKTGAFEYLLKPFKPRELLPVLARAMEVRRLKIENIELRHSVAMYELGRAISFSLDLKSILNALIDAAVEQCGADEASLMVPTDGGNELEVVAIRGAGRDGLLGTRVAFGRGIAGWVATNHEPLILHGTVEDERFVPVRSREDIRSSISLPMLVGGRLAGVLNVNATNARRPFSLDNLKGLNILAGMAGPAMLNCRLFQEVMESEERYRFLFSSMLEGYARFEVIFDGESPMDCVYLDTNEAFERIMGLSAVNGRRLSELWPDIFRTDPEVLEIYGKVALTGAPARFERYNTHLKKWVSVSTYSPAPRQVVAMFDDVTDRKRLEEQFTQSQKMEAIGRLAGGVAHDLNNLLSVIIANAGFIAEDLPENDPRRREIDDVLIASRRAADLTRQLLAFSRKQVLQPRVLDLNETIESMYKLLKRVIGEDIRLVNHTSEKLGTVMADPGQMEQVLMNLAVNARDAMPRGGTLTLETGNVELDDLHARLHDGVTAGPHVMLAVSDTGCGMDKETLSLIFEPFFTTKSEGKGTGLGLSTVYGIVKQSGGSIFVYSEPGEGSSFQIYLPRADRPVSRPSSTPDGPPPEGTETVLLVENDPGVRSVARMVLRRKGYTVIDTGDVEEAQRICTARECRIDLLLTDVVMPKLGGRELAERLHTLCPEMKVLYMSGYTDDVILHHGVLEAGTPFIQKPFSAETLPRKVREVLDT